MKTIYVLYIICIAAAAAVYSPIYWLVIGLSLYINLKLESTFNTVLSLIATVLILPGFYDFFQTNSTRPLTYYGVLISMVYLILILLNEKPGKSQD